MWFVSIDCLIFVFFLSLDVFFFIVFSYACVVFLFFFFKQKTAYDMRISDWSSDVCSSDLGLRLFEELTMGACVDEVDGPALTGAVIDVVDQQEIAADVTFTAPQSIPFQRMVTPLRTKWGIIGD